MDIKNISMIVISAIVGVIMIGSVLVPIVDNAIDNSKVYYNNEVGTYAQMGQDNISVEIETVIGSAGSTTYFVNGDEVDIPSGNRVFSLSSLFSISQSDSNGLVLAYVGENNSITKGYYSSIDISAVNGIITMTVVNDSNSNTLIFKPDWAFYRANSGDYRIMDYVSGTKTLFVNNLDQIYSSNLVNTTGGFFSLNGTNVIYYDNTGAKQELTANVTTTDVMEGVISFEVSQDRSVAGAFKFTIDNNGEPYDVLPYYMVFPSEVIGQTNTNVIISTLLSVLPILAISGLLVGMVGMAIYRRT